MTLATTRRRAKWLSPWICGLSGWLALAIGPPADAAAPSPRPLSEAERQGVILALDYFDQGIEAWWVSLAPDAPLRTFGAEAGLRELEVRTGPIAGATWRLQTTTAEEAENHAVFAIEYASGMDERLDLELRDDPDWGWRLVSVRSLADPPPAVEDAEAPADPEPEDLATLAPSQSADHRLPWFVSLSLSALVLAIAAMAVRRRRTAWLAGAGAVLLLGAAGALWLVPRLTIPEPRPADLETATAGDPSLPELGSLLALRRELASGAPPATVAISESGLAGDVERLWQAQRALDDGDLATARELLPTSSTDDAPALGDLLRARLATLAGDLTEAAIAYERAVESFPSHDGLWLEAAQALLVAGFEDRAMDYLERCAGIGSRDADVYYLLSAVDVYEAREDAAVEHFVTGWDLLAQERKDLFRQPAVSALMDRPEVLRRLDLSSTEEPKVVVPRSPGRALELPVGSRAQVAAAMLRVELAGATLLVPGGAELAPRGVEVVDGGAWERDEEEEALAELSSLITTSRSGLLVRPRLRRRLEVATRALGRLQRWDDLLEVTANLDRSPKDAPSEPLRWRALALERTGRGEEARDLLVQLARRNLDKQVREPGTLLQLADLLARDGEYDLAIRLTSRANSQLPLFADPQRSRRYRMDQQLASSYRVYRSRHFEVRYPRDRSSYLAERLANLMEEERSRLLRWIPAGEEPVEVHLIPFDEFMATFGGRIDILGLYDGKIRVPMADVWSFQPEIVAILSHELAHAMIADTTGNLAPRWFHEGLAQHVEMLSARANPMPDYDRAGGLLSLPMLEGALAGFTHPRLVAQSYDQAAWTVHYLERRYGNDGIRRLQMAFKEGRSTDEAIAAVLRRTLPEFDADLKRWWIYEAPSAWKTPVRRYVLSPDNSIRF